MNIRNLVKPRIKKYAKTLRNNQTRHELLLWKHLKRRKLHGLRFRRQAIIRGYIVDFYCPEKKLAVEVDGYGHDKARDLIRDNRIGRCGISVIRFYNAQVENKLSYVLESIATKCGFVSVSTNPQRQHHQQGNPLGNLDDENCVGANVEKIDNVQRIKALTVRSCEKIVEKNPPPKPTGCGGVFLTMEIAERNARFLSKFGRLFTAITCGKCGKIHVVEKGEQ